MTSTVVRLLVDSIAEGRTILALPLFYFLDSIAMSSLASSRLNLSRLCSIDGTSVEVFPRVNDVYDDQISHPSYDP